MPAEQPFRLSVLDLSPVVSGSSSSEALQNTMDLARLADKLGYTRYWMAEHHNTTSIASAAPEIMIGHVASVTRHIRVGSGGVMLPNHSPLKVAENFRLLEALHPGRIDLGIGRAPGTDQLAALALRRCREALSVDDFPDQLADLISFLSGDFPAGHPFGRITVIPAGAAAPEVWLLGSSSFSANLAAERGLSFAFAHHISPEPAVDALRLYQQFFRPSASLGRPRSILAVSAICAETDSKAELLARSVELGMLRFRQGNSAPLPSVEEATSYPYTAVEREAVHAIRSRVFVGSPARLREQLGSLAREGGAEEIMITTLVHDHRQRRRSYELLAEAFEIE